MLQAVALGFAGLLLAFATRRLGGRLAGWLAACCLLPAFLGCLLPARARGVY